jgi:hypothetical protein
MQGLGIVFYNYKDNAFQFVRTDGNEVVLFNNLSKEKVAQISNLDLNGKSIQEITKILNEDFKGADMYNSTKEYVEKNLEKQEDGTFIKKTDIPSGIIFIAGPCKIQTDATTHNFDKKGAYVLRDKKGKTRAVEFDVFHKTYDIKTETQSQKQRSLIKRQNSLTKKEDTLPLIKKRARRKSI